MNGEPQTWLEADIEALQAAMAGGELSAAELTGFYLDRIDALDKRLNSIQVLNPGALEDARLLDAERSDNGPRSPLHGIPVLIKDNYETRGMPTTAGSILFEGFAPDRDAHLVERLKSAGAVILGKTTMHEFAYGITTVGSGFGETRNPYDLSRNPGGSSGGTGAAIGAGLAVVGMGSDTCGSIRIPAAQNNLVGLRGTQGLSSRRGIIPLSHTQDIGGPLARSIKDLSLVLDMTVGIDPADAQTLESSGRRVGGYADRLEVIEGARIGLLQEYLVQDPEDEVVAAVISETLSAMSANSGWEIIDIGETGLREVVEEIVGGFMVATYDFHEDINAYVAANPELGYANLDAIIADGRAHEHIVPRLQASAAMGEEQKQQYLEALAQRKTLRRMLLGLMAEHQLDALVYPTIRRLPVEIGEADQPGTNCPLSANSGLPALSVPAGFVDGIPVGIELMAESWAEQKLLNLGLTIESKHSQRRMPTGFE